MWTPATRKQHIRETNRYQTDVTDEEWRVIAPHLPVASSTGRPRAWPMREIINGIFYVMRAGASATRSSTRMGVALCSNHIRRASKIVTAADRFCTPRAASSHLFSGSSPTADMRVRRLLRPP